MPINQQQCLVIIEYYNIIKVKVNDYSKNSSFCCKYQYPGDQRLHWLVPSELRLIETLRFSCWRSVAARQWVVSWLIFFWFWSRPGKISRRTSGLERRREDRTVSPLVHPLLSRPAATPPERSVPFTSHFSLLTRQFCRGNTLHVTPGDTIPVTTIVLYEVERGGSCQTQNSFDCPSCLSRTFPLLNFLNIPQDKVCQEADKN